MIKLVGKVLVFGSIFILLVICGTYSEESASSETEITFDDCYMIEFRVDYKDDMQKYGSPKLEIYGNSEFERHHLDMRYLRSQKMIELNPIFVHGITPDLDIEYSHDYLTYTQDGDPRFDREIISKLQMKMADFSSRYIRYNLTLEDGKMHGSPMAPNAHVKLEAPEGYKVKYFIKGPVETYIMGEIKEDTIFYDGKYLVFYYKVEDGITYAFSKDLLVEKGQNEWIKTTVPEYKAYYNHKKVMGDKVCTQKRFSYKDTFYTLLDLETEELYTDTYDYAMTFFYEDQGYGHIVFLEDLVFDFEEIHVSPKYDDLNPYSIYFRYIHLNDILDIRDKDGNRISVHRFDPTGAYYRVKNSQGDVVLEKKLYRSTMYVFDIKEYGDYEIEMVLPAFNINCRVPFEYEKLEGSIYGGSVKWID